MIDQPEIRIRKNAIEMPIIFLEDGCKREVILVGACHISDQDYFSNVQFFLDSHEKKGYKILFEMVGAVSRKEKKMLVGRARRLFYGFNKLFGYIGQIPVLLGATYQKTGIKYSDSWINTDISIGDLVKRLAAAGVKPFQVPDVDMTNATVQMVLRLFFNYGMGNIMAVMTIMPLICKRDNGFQSVILDYRNEVAVQGIVDHIDHNVISFWGAAHLPGMVKLLQKHGFKEVRKEWIPAYNLQRKT